MLGDDVTVGEIRGYAGDLSEQAAIGSPKGCFGPHATFLVTIARESRPRKSYFSNLRECKRSPC